MPAVLRDYRPVTADRLKNPEDENWLMIRRTCDGWGFSPLTQITAANAARLRPAGGDSRGMQATLNNLFPGEYPECLKAGQCGCLRWSEL